MTGGAISTAASQPSTLNTKISGSAMFSARKRQQTWAQVFALRMETRHLWRSIGSKSSHPFFSRGQQSTVLLTTTLTSMFLCAVLLHTPNSSTTSADSTVHISDSLQPAESVGSGILSAIITFPLVNFLSYLFITCGRLRHSVSVSNKYGAKKWRPTSIYALLWLSSILYAFCVLICASCAFLILLHGTKMDGGQGSTWLLASIVAIFVEGGIIRPLFCLLEAAWTMRRPVQQSTLVGSQDSRGVGSTSLSSISRSISRRVGQS